MISENTQFGDGAFEVAVFPVDAHYSHVFSRSSDTGLYRISTIGEDSTITSDLTPLVSSPYDWRCDCDYRRSSRTSQATLRCFEERLDAQNHESGERRSGLDVERSDGRRECHRVEIAVQVGSGRSPYCPGLKRPHSRGSRSRQISRALRNGQHQAQELPSIHPRVDHARTGCRLAVHRTSAGRNKRRATFGLPFREIEIESCPS
jgi:hypothetical protein